MRLYNNDKPSQHRVETAITEIIFSLLRGRGLDEQDQIYDKIIDWCWEWKREIKISKLLTEKEKAIARQDFDLATKLREEIRVLTGEPEEEIFPDNEN
jgi:hypothetical protein